MPEEVLNLDAFIPTKRYLELEGKRYEVLDLCVEAYLALTEVFQRLREAQEKGDEAGQVKASVEIAQALVPDLPPKVLERMPLPALEQVTAFLLKPLQQQEEDAGGDEGPPGEGES